MWQAIWQILCDSAIYILVGFLIAGALQVLMAGSHMIRWLSRRGSRSVLLAALVGVPLPLCSCSVLPAAVTLRRKGASKGAMLSFLISTPETSATSIMLTYSLLGPLMAVFRPIAACVTAIAAGLAENLFGKRPGEPEAEGVPAGSTPENDLPEGVGTSSLRLAPKRLKEGLRYAFVDLFDDIFIWIMVGIVAAAAIQALLPAAAFHTLFRGTWVSMLLMLVLGIPLYVCAEASTPIAAAFIAKGVNPGAALVLLLVGPATNIGSVGVLYRQLGRRTILVYLTTIAIVALLMGWLLNALVATATLQAAVRPFREPLVPEWLKVAGAVAFLLLGLFTVRRRRYWQRAINWLDARLPVRVTTARAVAGVGVAAVALYLGAGFFAVQPGELGVVKRFGAIVRDDVPPGLHYAWPWPIEEAECVPVRQVYRLVLGFGSGGESDSEDGTAADESWTLIGDENIADLKSAVHWGAIPEELTRYQYGIADREGLVRSVALGAIREVLGGRTINRGFTTDRRACEARIEALIRQRLVDYAAGIRVHSFHFLDAHAPSEVHDAFRDVASALEDKSTQINLALAQEARVVPLARGEAKEKRAQADGYAAKTIAESSGETQRFTDLLNEYCRWPDITRQRLYFETLERILPGLRKYIRTTGAGVGELEIWLVNPRVGGGLPWQPGAEMR